MTKLPAPVVNREQKDHLFRMIFSDKEKLLELYNALTGRNYSDPSLLEINTLENAIYLSMRNDLSFLIDMHMYLFGHQSSWNPNSPYRFLLYAADIYSAFTKDKNIYSSSLIHLPAPRFYIFYNGLDRNIGDRVELRLSDAFKEKEKKPARAEKKNANGTGGKNTNDAGKKNTVDATGQNADDVKEGKSCPADGENTVLSIPAAASENEANENPWLELKVVVLNINSGHNKKLMEACKPLHDYAEYVSRVRRYAKAMDIQDAVERVVDECIRENILADFLSQNRAEAIKMSIYEYDEEQHMQMEREEHYHKGFEDGEAKGREEGKAEGIAEGRFAALADLIQDGMLTLDQAADRMFLTPEAFREQCKKSGIRL